MKRSVRKTRSMRAAAAAAGPNGVRAPRKRALAAVIALLGIAPQSALGGLTYYVDTTGDPGPEGTTSLRQAVAIANAADDNGVAFDPSLSGSVITLEQGEIAVDHSITITGPGAGELTISAQYNSRIFNFTAAVDGKTATVAGLTLTEGYASGLPLEHYGGAIYASKMGVVMHDVVITLSKAPAYGGGGLALVRAGPSSIVGSTITGNSSYSCGGVRAFDTDLVLQDSLVTANQAVSGGGLCLFGGHTSILHSRISGNSASWFGAGIYASGYNLIDLNLSPHLEIDSSVISGNRTGQCGGGLFAKLVPYVAVSRSLISANTTLNSAGRGSGIAVYYIADAFKLYDVTIADNSSSFGAGVLVGDYWQTITNTDFRFVTIAGNHGAWTGETGNGIDSPTASVNLKQSIVANNLSGDGQDDLAGTFVLDHSLIRHPGAAMLSGSGLIGADPQLSALSDHGGPTWTMLPAAGSPAIDATDVDIAPGTDQRGFLRVVGAHADIGAVERQDTEDIVFRDGFDSF